MWHLLAAGVLGSQDQGAGGPSCLGPEADGTRDGGDQDTRCVPQADKQLDKQIYIYINSFTVAGRAGSEEPVEAHWGEWLYWLCSPYLPYLLMRHVQWTSDWMRRESYGLEKLHRTWQSRTNDSVRHVILSRGNAIKGVGRLNQIVELRFYDFIWLFVCFCPMRYLVSLLKNLRTLMRRQPTPKEQRQDFAVAATVNGERKTRVRMHA